MMSQLAENQSAIIENENNCNIVMESQAAMEGINREQISVDHAENEGSVIQKPEAMEVEENVDANGSASAEVLDAEFITLMDKSVEDKSDNIISKDSHIDSDLEPECTRSQCQVDDSDKLLAEEESMDVENEPIKSDATENVPLLDPENIERLKERITLPVSEPSSPEREEKLEEIVAETSRESAVVQDSDGITHFEEEETLASCKDVEEGAPESEKGDNTPLHSEPMEDETIYKQEVEFKDKELEHSPEDNLSLIPEDDGGGCTITAEDKDRLLSSDGAEGEGVVLSNEKSGTCEKNENDEVQIMLETERGTSETDQQELVTNDSVELQHETDTGVENMSSEKEEREDKDSVELHHETDTGVENMSSEKEEREDKDSVELHHETDTGVENMSSEKEEREDKDSVELQHETDTGVENMSSEKEEREDKDSAELQHETDTGVENMSSEKEEREDTRITVNSGEDTAVADDNDAERQFNETNDKSAKEIINDNDINNADKVYSENDEKDTSEHGEDSTPETAADGDKQENIEMLDAPENEPANSLVEATNKSEGDTSLDCEGVSLGKDVVIDVLEKSDAEPFSKIDSISKDSLELLGETIVKSSDAPTESDDKQNNEIDAKTLPGEDEGKNIDYTITTSDNKVDTEDMPTLMVTDVKSGVEAGSEDNTYNTSVADDSASKDDTCEIMETDDSGVKGTENAKVTEAINSSAELAANTDSSEKQDLEKLASEDGKDSGFYDHPPTLTKETDVQPKVLPPDDDDDVVVLDDDDDDDTPPKVKKESEKNGDTISTELFNSNNDMGIQITSVSGGADELHDMADHPAKQRGDQEHVSPGVKKEIGGTSTSMGKKVPPKSQTCIVCKRVGKCKYNIVRNGDIKHLCDDTCFQRFRTNPSMYLKGTASSSGKKDKDVSAPVTGSAPQQSATTAVKPGQSPAVQGYKTCVVCQLMNINTQGQFCMWKGLDFCGENCLGKFQANLNTSCTLCTAYIPLTARSGNCLRIGSEVRPFCSNRCYSDYKQRMRLCSFCQKDLASADSFSAPVGSEGAFRDFCSQACMKKYEDSLSNDVEIIRVEQGKPQPTSKCSVCQKMETAKHSVKYSRQVHHLCSDPCLSAFQYANKLDMNACDHCGTLCTTLESSPHFVQFEGQQKRFCSDSCVNNFRTTNRKISPCAWCGSKKANFDMIERLDANNKYQLFCSLNCLSLYRVNLQAKSNQSVVCDQCMKFVPAQYHLTMSDASVRNFCSYNCVMTFQAQFTSKGQPAVAPPSQPKHKHNTRGNSQSSASQPSFPIISNVVSLAPQGGQKVNIKSSSGIPVVVSGSSPTVKSAGAPIQTGGQIQQQIIIQPPPPKVVKNKSLLCKPFIQSKATSCRPHTQNKECQTEPLVEKPALIPVPVPIFIPTPMAMYNAPAPVPIFIPIPIPVPCFIPTTRKSANGIMKQIKEIQEKIPTDPLEAEILMMAAAVATDGKNSSDSESDEEMIPDVAVVSKGRLSQDEEEDNDADIMPLSAPKESEEGGEEDMIQMALRMAEEMSGPIADLESAVEAVPINTEPPPQPPREPSPVETMPEEEYRETRARGRGAKRSNTIRRSGGRPPKRPRITAPQPEINSNPIPPEALVPQIPPADANYHLKFTYGVNAWRHWVVFKNAQLDRAAKRGGGRIKLFKTDILQCTADELNYSLCLFVKEVKKPNGEEYSPDSIYYLCLGIQQYLFENARIDNIFTDLYYEKFTECLTDLLSNCQPKFNAAGQMVCRIEEEHLWECKQLGAHSPYVLLNTLIYFHTKYFMLKTPEDHMKLSFAHILKYWKKGQPTKTGQPTRSVSLRYYSVSTAKKDGSAPTSTTKKGSKEGIPVYEVTENQDNPLRCPVKLYEFYLSKCPESIKNRSDIFYPVPERSCVPDSPVWYSTSPIGIDTMTKMLTRILLVREIQEAHLHAQPIYV